MDLCKDLPLDVHISSLPKSLLTVADVCEMSSQERLSCDHVGLKAQLPVQVFEREMHSGICGSNM